MQKQLVYIESGLPVKNGDTVTTFRGESAKVVGWAAPRTEASTGRVALVIEGSTGWQEYYPSIINAEFRDKPAATEFKVEVIADSSGVWSSNQRRFETEDKAFAYGENLAERWTAVRQWRVVPAQEATDAQN